MSLTTSVHLASRVTLDILRPRIIRYCIQLINDACNTYLRLEIHDKKPVWSPWKSYLIWVLKRQMAVYFSMILDKKRVLLLPNIFLIYARTIENGMPYSSATTLIGSVSTIFRAIDRCSTDRPISQISGNHRSGVDSPHNGPVMRTFKVFFVVRVVGDLRRRDALVTP